MKVRELIVQLLSEDLDSDVLIECGDSKPQYVMVDGLAPPVRMRHGEVGIVPVYELLTNDQAVKRYSL